MLFVYWFQVFGMILTKVIFDQYLHILNSVNSNINISIRSLKIQ